MRKKSSSKHLEKYVILMKWEKSEDIPIKQLAKNWGVNQNKVIALIGSAKRNSTIFMELRELGYADEQIPKWFARPKKKDYLKILKKERESIRPDLMKPVPPLSRGKEQVIQHKYDDVQKIPKTDESVYRFPVKKEKINLMNMLKTPSYELPRGYHLEPLYDHTKPPKKSLIQEQYENRRQIIISEYSEELKKSFVNNNVESPYQTSPMNEFIKNIKDPEYLKILADMDPRSMSNYLKLLDICERMVNPTYKQNQDANFMLSWWSWKQFFAK